MQQSAKAPIEYATVPRLFPGQTIVILATGPSLCAEDVDYCRGKARVFAIKDAVRLAPWADVLYGAGLDGGGRTGPWWVQHGPSLQTFGGLKFTLDPLASAWASVLRFSARPGLSTDQGVVAAGGFSGNNSGAQAIDIAVKLGAARIVLLGYDAKADEAGRDHWFGAHPWKPKLNYAAWPKVFADLVAPLRALNIRIINASRVSAITCFDRCSLAEALA